MKPELEPGTPNRSPEFDTARGPSLGHSPTPPPARTDREPDYVPEPQIPEPCIHEIARDIAREENIQTAGELKFQRAESFHPARHPDIPIRAGFEFVPMDPVEAVDLTAPPKRVRFAVDESGEVVDLTTTQEETPKSQNMMYILLGLAFVGAAIWIGEDRPSAAVMPYY